MQTVKLSRSDLHRAAELRWRDVPPGIPDDLAAEFVARLKAGGTIRKLTCGMKRYGPPLVSYERFKKHCDLHPEWGAEAWKISRENVIILKGARLRALTHCKHGHPFSGENLYVTPNGKRKCLACCRRRHLAPVMPTQEEVRRATAMLNAGSSVTLICTGKRDGKRIQVPVFGFRKLKLLRAVQPLFDRLVLSVTSGSNSRGQQRRHNPVKAAREMEKEQTNDFYRILAMIPKHLSEDDRHDIAHSVFLALFEGSLQRDQVCARVRSFVINHQRAFPTRYAKFGDSPLLSLDEALYDDGSGTRGDNVSRGLWD